jgi:hypothetical protein
MGLLRNLSNVNLSRQHRAVESILKGGDQLVHGSGADIEPIAFLGEVFCLEDALFARPGVTFHPQAAGTSPPSEGSHLLVGLCKRALSRQRTRDKEQETNFTAPCKLASAAAAVPDDLSCIERGSARGFLLAKISESQFLSSRRRSNIIPRAPATGRPSPLARWRRCRVIQDKCKASSACPSPSG